MHESRTGNREFIWSGLICLRFAPLILYIVPRVDLSNVAKNYMFANLQTLPKFIRLHGDQNISRVKFNTQDREISENSPLQIFSLYGIRVLPIQVGVSIIYGGVVVINIIFVLLWSEMLWFLVVVLGSVSEAQDSVECVASSNALTGVRTCYEAVGNVTQRTQDAVQFAMACTDGEQCKDLWRTMINSCNPVSYDDHS